VVNPMDRSPEEPARPRARRSAPRRCSRIPKYRVRGRRTMLGFRSISTPAAQLERADLAGVYSIWNRPTSLDLRALRAKVSEGGTPPCLERLVQLVVASQTAAEGGPTSSRGPPATRDRSGDASRRAARARRARRAKVPGRSTAPRLPERQETTRYVPDIPGVGRGTHPKPAGGARCALASGAPAARERSTSRARSRSSPRTAEVPRRGKVSPRARTGSARTTLYDFCSGALLREIEPKRPERLRGPILADVLAAKDGGFRDLPGLGRPAHATAMAALALRLRASPEDERRPRRPLGTGLRSRRPTMRRVRRSRG
jgi:hypothetical protein